MLLSVRVLKVGNSVILDALQLPVHRIVKTQILVLVEKEQMERIAMALMDIMRKIPEHFLAAWGHLTTLEERKIFAEIVAGTGLELPNIALRDQETWN
jgi:hypothetical protein